jgi:uncharacterized membrane protein YozB (DUF420 family)
MSGKTSPSMRDAIDKVVKLWGGRAFLALMLVGSALITAMSLSYFDFENLPPFVIEKLPMRFEATWLSALRIHVAAAALGFPLCLSLLTRALQRRTAWHRWLGRAAGVVVLFVLVPSGVVLSFSAKGGVFVTLGFLLSAAIIGWAMVSGVRAARRRALRAHARAMQHVVAQMSVAVTSRALIVGLDLAGIDPDVAYVAALWVPVLLSAAAVEWMTRRPVGTHENNVWLFERIARELSPLPLFVRIRAFIRPFARLGR